MQNLQNLKIESWLMFLVVGALAGFIAATVTRGRGLGLIANLLVGVIGAVVGFWLLGLAGVSFGVGVVGTLVTATLGAVALLAVAGVIGAGFRRRSSW